MCLAWCTFPFMFYSIWYDVQTSCCGYPWGRRRSLLYSTVWRVWGWYWPRRLFHLHWRRFVWEGLAYYCILFNAFFFFSKQSLVRLWEVLCRYLCFSHQHRLGYYSSPISRGQNVFMPQPRSELITSHGNRHFHLPTFWRIWDEW